MPEYYLGLMSGTSVDGIDAALVDLDAHPPRLLHAQTYPWPQALQRKINETIEHHQAVSLKQLGTLDAAIGEQFAQAALATIRSAGLETREVCGIGSHGQTLFHAPDIEPAFSLQVGDPNRIAQYTGIRTVADFRRRDIAAGGQGAPLVPAFHQAVFHSREVTRAVLNIGGMANLTLLPKTPGNVSGFDTGPGNALLDGWYRKHHQSAWDRDGEWARSGTLVPSLLERLLAHPYFDQPPPKSTGRETFCLHWLEEQLQETDQHLRAADIQCTLVEFSAQSIARALRESAADIEQLLVCGGGVHNCFLMERLGAALTPCRMESTEQYGIHPDWVEAIAFAWLARQTLQGKPGNLPSVTGARHPVVLGAIYPGNNSR